MCKTPKLIVRKDLLSKSGKARIEFLIYFEGKQYRVSSGKTIEPKYWIKESESVDKRSEDATAINSYLSERLNEFDKYKFRKKALDEQLLLDDIKNILKGLPIESDSNGKDIVYPTISKAFKDYVNYNKMKPGTKKNYQIAKNVIKDFCLTKYRKEITIDKIDYNFLITYTKYLREDRPIANNQNTIAKKLKLLKSVFRFSNRKGNFKLEDPFIDFPIESGKPREIALSKKEYECLRKSILPPKACNSLRLSKHIFIFCAETGLRFSDAMDLSWQHIDEKISSLEKIQVKTNKPVFVPISPPAKAILIIYRKKYQCADNYVFPRIDIQVMNRYLKELAKISGIEKNLTSHVARHTFGTRLGASGKASAFMICKLMGHEDIGMSQRYINLSKDDLRKTMADVWNQK